MDLGIEMGAASVARKAAPAMWSVLQWMQSETTSPFSLRTTDVESILKKSATSVLIYSVVAPTSSSHLMWIVREALPSSTVIVNSTRPSGMPVDAIVMGPANGVVEWE